MTATRGTLKRTDSPQPARLVYERGREELEINEVKAQLEAILIGAGRWLKLDDLARALRLSRAETVEVLERFEEDLMNQVQLRGIQLRRRAQTVRVELKPAYVPLLGEAIPEFRPKPISDQADEVLAVIIHLQPISTSGVTEIRGIDSAAVVTNLAERGMIQRRERLGQNRERLWKVSQRFLDLHHLDKVEDIFKEGVMERVFPGLAVQSPES